MHCHCVLSVSFVLASFVSFVASASLIFSTTRKFSYTGTDRATKRHATASDGLNYASSCNAASISWSNANVSWHEMTTPPGTNCSATSTEATYTISLTNVSVPWITLCDGHARPPKSWVWPMITSTQTFLYTICALGSPKRIHTGPYPVQPPQCTIDNRDCERLYSTFVADGGWLYDGGNPSPICTTSKEFNPGCEICHIYGYGVQLYYWPVEVLRNNDCNGNGSTITAKPTALGSNK